MTTEIKKHTKSLNEIEVMVRGMIALQLAGQDIAIPYLQGAPGCGKTALIHEWGNKNNWQVFSCHFSRIPIEEISGIPEFVDIDINGTTVKGTAWSYPELLTKIHQLDPKKPIILFLDDFHLCSPSHLELGFEMFTNRSIRGYKLPDNLAFMLAGNNSSKAGTKTGNSAIINRCGIYPVFMDFNYWKNEFAIKQHLNYKIVTFLSNEKYRKFFHGTEDSNNPWPSPRAWTRLSVFLNPLERAFTKINHSDLLYYTAAHVGNEAAAEFAAYYRLYLETEMDLVFDNKKPIKIPSDMSGLYIYTIAASAEYIDRYVKLGSGQSVANKKIELNKTFCSILSQVNKINTSIPIVGAIEVTNFGSKSIFIDLTNTMKTHHSELFNTIIAELEAVSR
jgi:hypothetical protein